MELRLFRMEFWLNCCPYCCMFLIWAAAACAAFIPGLVMESPLGNLWPNCCP